MYSINVLLDFSTQSSRRKRRQLEESEKKKKVPEHLSQKDLVQLLITLFSAVHKGFPFLLKVQPVARLPTGCPLAGLIFCLRCVQHSAATFFVFSFWSKI